MGRKPIPITDRGRVLTNVSMPVPMRVALEERADAERTTLSDIVRRVLGEYLERPLPAKDQAR